MVLGAAHGIVLRGASVEFLRIHSRVEDRERHAICAAQRSGVGLRLLPTVVGEEGVVGGEGGAGRRSGLGESAGVL